MLLEHLVREIDAQLFEAVVLEDFEPKNVQNPKFNKNSGNNQFILVVEACPPFFLFRG